MSGIKYSSHNSGPFSPEELEGRRKFLKDRHGPAAPCNPGMLCWMEHRWSETLALLEQGKTEQHDG